MTIHLLAPKDKSKWHSLWHRCYKIWETSPYQIKMWNDEVIDELLINDDKEFFDEYLNYLDPIYKFDYVRFIILKLYGGVYCDMDVAVVTDFIPLIKENKIYMIEGESGEYVSNSIMISKPSFGTKDTWKKIQDVAKFNVIRNFIECKEFKYLTIDTVGPIFLSNWFSRHKETIQQLGVNLEILGYNQFQKGDDADIVFTKHYCTHTWSDGGKFEFPKNYFNKKILK